MKKQITHILFLLLLGAVVCACSGDIDIQQRYEFTVSHLPVPKSLKIGETAEIRCQLNRYGNYENTRYYIRYFQPDGDGILSFEDDRVLTPNDTFELPGETFRLYYTSSSTDQQVIDCVFFDSFGTEFELSFSFNNDSKEEETNN